MMKRLAAAVLSLATMLLAGAAHAQNYSIAFTPTVQNAAYASGNAIGGLQTVNFFQNGARFSGVIDIFDVYSAGGSTTPLTFYIFDKTPIATTCTDKSALVVGAADLPKLAVAPFTLTPAAPTGTTISSAQLVQATSIRNADIIRGSSVYVCIVVGGTVTPATTTDLTVKFSGALD